jgi:hypothetical protein
VSSTEHEPILEPRSSIEINLTAKGTRQWRVKVYAADFTEGAVDEACNKAVELEGRLATKYGVAS